MITHNITVNKNKVMTHQEWKEYEKKRRINFILEMLSFIITIVSFVKEKFFALSMIAMGIITPFILQGDATFSLIVIPLGISLLKDER